MKKSLMISAVVLVVALLASSVLAGVTIRDTSSGKEVTASTIWDALRAFFSGGATGAAVGGTSIVLPPVVIGSPGDVTEDGELNQDDLNDMFREFFGTPTPPSKPFSLPKHDTNADLSFDLSDPINLLYTIQDGTTRDLADLGNAFPLDPHCNFTLDCIEICDDSDIDTVYDPLVGETWGEAIGCPTVIEFQNVVNERTKMLANPGLSWADFEISADATPDLVNAFAKITELNDIEVIYKVGTVVVFNQVIGSVVDIDDDPTVFNGAGIDESVVEWALSGGFTFFGVSFDLWDSPVNGEEDKAGELHIKFKDQDGDRYDIVRVDPAETVKQKKNSAATKVEVK